MSETTETEKLKRLDGHYWIRQVGPFGAQAWHVAEWRSLDRDWFLPGNSLPLKKYFPMYLSLEVNETRLQEPS